MSQWMAMGRNLFDAVDTDLIRFYRVGLVLGVLAVSTLTLFPGRDANWSKKLAEGSQPTTNGGDKVQSPNKNDATQSLHSPHNYDPLNDDYCVRTPHQNMNTMVYLVLFTVAAFVLDHLYGGLISAWLRIYFPKEASLFGL